jgi:hypothetical protein
MNEFKIRERCVNTPGVAHSVGKTTGGWVWKHKVLIAQNWLVMTLLRSTACPLTIASHSDLGKAMCCVELRMVPSTYFRSFECSAS